MIPLIIPVGIVWKILFGALIGAPVKVLIFWVSFLFFKFIKQTQKFTLWQGHQLGHQIEFFHTIPPGMIRGIAGIKNEVKRIRRSFYSTLGSALTKNPEKVVRHFMFWGPIWTRNDPKIAFFSFSYSATSKIWSKIVAHLIFFPVKADMLYIWAVIFGAPIWCPRSRYFVMKSHILG